MFCCLCNASGICRAAVIQGQFIGEGRLKYWQKWYKGDEARITGDIGYSLMLPSEIMNK